MLLSTIPVKGVPFLNSTRHRKSMKLIHRDNQKLIVEMENRSLDIPYADCFYVEERWNVLSDSPTTQKCILR